MSQIHKKTIDELVKSWERRVCIIDNLIKKTSDNGTLNRLQIKRGSINGLLLEVKLLTTETCTWAYDDIDGNHDTECGRSHYFPDGTIEENGYKFCPFCGKEMEEVTDE